MGLELMAAVQIAGVAIGAGGAAAQYVGSQQQASASKEAEAARRSKMELEGMRQRREILRRAQIAQSTALTRTTAQTGSAATSGSSALPGSYGQITAQGNEQLGNLGANLDIGNRIFDANSDAADSASISAMGKGFSTIGGALLQNSKAISEIGTSSLFGVNLPNLEPDFDPMTGLRKNKEWGYM